MTKLEQAITVLEQEYLRLTNCDLSWYALGNHADTFDQSDFVEYIEVDGRERSSIGQYKFVVIEVSIGTENVLLRLNGWYDSWCEDFNWEDPPYLVKAVQITSTIYEEIKE